MKLFLYPIVRTDYFCRAFLTFAFSFFLTLFSLDSHANTVVIGTGSGTVSRTSMGNLNAGDTLAITAGTYSGGGQFGGLNNITIINYGGVVTFTAAVDFGAQSSNVNNITWTGTGSNGNTYGFVFDATGSYGVGPVGYTTNGGFIFTAQHYTQIRFNHIWFKSLTGNAFDMSGNLPTYDGSIASLGIYKATFSYCRADNLSEFYQGPYKNPNFGFQDSVDISYNIFNQTIANGLTVNAEITNFNIHHNQILYSGYNPLPNDVGVFSITGFGQVHHNYMKGGRGWLARISGCSFKGNPVGTFYGYDNIKMGSTSYGMFDMRSDSVNFFAPVSNFFQHCNFQVTNNTLGNLTANDANGTGTGNGYNTPAALFYVMDGGSTGVVKNNLGFNSIVGASGGYICISFATSNGVGLGFSRIDTSNNKYYPASSILNVLSDTNANCAVKSGAPIIGAGLGISLVTTDYSGRSRANPPTIGAEEFSSSASSVTANAGSNQTIALPLDSVSLSGSGSTVTGSTISSYKWSQVSGPSTASFSSATSVATRATKLVTGTYVFGLKVKDANNDSSSVTVTITVNAANQPPAVNAGANQTITLPTNSVTLAGSATDLLGISSYLWTQASGPNTAAMASSSSSSTSVTGLIAGTYVFQLKVLDILNLSSIASVSVTVNPAVNQPPVVSAGSNQTITMPTSTVTLTGSATDATGTIKSYLWSQVSGPNTSSITNASSSSTSITAMTAGTYVFQLKATDNGGLSATATVNVTVNTATNQPPVVSAGTAQTITLPISTVTLTGTASDGTGTISSYSWTQVSGPSTSAIASPAAIKTNVSGLVAGTYVFQLKATDNDGLSATATVNVTVNPAPNQPPVVNAGTAQTITLPLSIVTLTGTASDGTGTISSYSWTQVSGPSTSAIASPAAIKTNVSSLVAGTYVFQLKATDNGGLSATANVTVTVNAAPNQPPVANAGANQTITLPVSTVSVDGSTSKDADGVITSFKWAQISGPSQGTIANATNVTTTISNLVKGTYLFKLTVTDNSGASASDTVTVTVNAAANQPPVVSAGSAQTITLPASTVTLTGTASDATGTISSYSWTQVSGPNTSIIASPSAIKTNVSGLIAGTYVFQFKATDNGGLSATSTVTITVNPVPNQPPTVSAGSAQTITLPTSTLTLTGTASDATGTISSYSWTQISGPNTSNIASPAAIKTNVSGLIAGTYVFQFKATDNGGLSATSTVTITVNPALNQPPVVSAGTAQTITLPVNTVTLTGTASDATGTITSYSWIQVSGPNTSTIASPSAIKTNVSGLIAGIYVFQFKATDNGGLSATANITITVNPAPNQPPVANAGANQTITLPVSSVSVDGSASKDADGVITAFKWAQISGPSQGAIANANSVTSTISSLVQGIYLFKLTVTDNSGATASDTITVTVNAAPNQSPIANAGSSKTITLPVSTTTLDGTLSSDPDGTIASYKWAQVSGPSTATVSGRNSATAALSSLVAGTYVFQLTVTDNNGATGTAQVKVIVNPAVNVAPTANAGNDQTITLPTNSTTLDGSSSKDPDGVIVSFNWSKISGPSTGTIASSNNVTTVVSNLSQGTYVYLLTVTDNNGALDMDTVTVTVNPAPNQPPVANAGSSRTITLPVNSTTLDGTKSSDPDGSIASYNWVELSGPSTATTSDITAATLNVSNLVEGHYVFQLTVTDNSGANSVAEVNVTVNPAANVNPIANGGANQTITLPVDSVNVDGSASVAPSGSITSYKWAQVSGPSQATITDATSAASLITELVQGTYIFQLTVTDNNGNTDTDSLTVTVKAAINKLPISNAGTSQTIILPIDSISLDGSKSSDPDGTIVSYSWIQLRGPSSAILDDASSSKTMAGSLIAGTYYFQLTVTDNSGATSKSTIRVSVIPAANQAPIANAGANQTITLPVNTVNVDGSASVDADGSIASYKWSQVSGPSSSTIASSSNVATAINNLIQGIYSFKLTVTDNKGAIATDTITITVNEALNKLPVANAGASKTITLPVDSVILDGSKSYDPDGSIVSFLWNQVSGPASASISDTASTTPTISSLVAGQYAFQLTVTDNSGATSVSQVKVTVLPAADLGPIADAGTDQSLTMPVGNVTLDGSKSYDPDGTIASYSWIKASGTGAVTISNSNTAKPTISGLQAGSYSFRLTVVDNRGAAASAQVSVTIAAAVIANKPPVAKAGSDQTITLPLDSVRLDGTKSSDPDGSIAYYSWSEASGSAGINISNPNTATPEITNLQAGQYVFQLVVTDNKGTTDTSVVNITVHAASVIHNNQPPVANAGKDTTIAIPATTAILNGSASTDPSGSIINYAWTQVSGPSTAGISSPDASVSDINTLVAGVYKFELTVTDDQGATSTTDTVKVTVLDNTRTNAATSAQNMLLYPNPASGSINLQVTSTETGSMKVFVYDMRGRMVMVKEYSKPATFFSTPINISLLFGGTYTMQVKVGRTTVMVNKFIKQ